MADHAVRKVNKMAGKVVRNKNARKRPARSKVQTRTKKQDEQANRVKKKRR